MESTDTSEQFARGTAVLRVIHLGIGGGLAGFMAVIWVLSQQPVDAPAASLDQERILAFASVAVMAVNTILAHVLFRIQLRKIQWPAGQPMNERTATPFISVFLSAHMMRLALIEGAALFAAVVLLLVVRATGTLDFKDPTVQLPMAAVGTFLLFWALWFPSREAILTAMKPRL